jgi:hypothetical protein
VFTWGTLSVGGRVKSSVSEGDLFPSSGEVKNTCFKKRKRKKKKRKRKKKKN